MNARFAIPFALRLLLFTLVAVAAAGSAHAVLLPVLSPDGGRYATYRPVKVTCGTAGATLRYTLCGLEPTAADPLVASGASITLSSDSQLRVKAFGTDGTTSLKTADYRFIGQISANGSHTLLLQPNGVVWAWGSNAYGQLGDGTLVSRAAPARVAALGKAKAIVAGSRHSLVVLDDGTVWAWGENVAGQLGLGHTFSAGFLLLLQQIPANGSAVIVAPTLHGGAVGRTGSLQPFGAVMLRDDLVATVRLKFELPALGITVVVGPDLDPGAIG